MRPTAATHAIDMNQRYVPLAFTKSGTQMTATAPAVRWVAPPGDYMLIVKNSAGVPSVASWIRIGSVGQRPARDHRRDRDRQRDVGTDRRRDRLDGRASTTTMPPVPIAHGRARRRVPGHRRGEQLCQRGPSGHRDRRPNDHAGRRDVAPWRCRRPRDHSATGRPLPGVTVGYPGGVTVTDATGHYSITGLPAGSHDVTFAATGFVSADRTVTVTAGGITTLDVQLAPTATFVTGEVRDGVTQRRPCRRHVSVDTGQTTTGGEGRYRIDLPPGTVSGHGVRGRLPVASDGHRRHQRRQLRRSTSASSRPRRPARLTFTPIADSTVKSSNPTKNYRDRRGVRLRLGDALELDHQSSYLRFAVSGLAGRGVTGAKLRLHVTDAGLHWAGSCTDDHGGVDGERALVSNALRRAVGARPSGP